MGGVKGIQGNEGDTRKRCDKVEVILLKASRMG